MENSECLRIGVMWFVMAFPFCGALYVLGSLGWFGFNESAKGVGVALFLLGVPFTLQGLAMKMHFELAEDIWRKIH